MSIALGTVAVKHERRIRLLFTNVLASGAFTNLSLYVVTCLDSSGTDPAVVQAFVVGDNPDAVELALGSDLTPGGIYQVSAVGVPCTDTTVTPSGSIANFSLGQSTVQVNVEAAAKDFDLVLYGRDIVWNGDDFAEDATGDLMTATGVAMAAQAVQRRLLADGLPWDPSYGPNSRQYVDGVPGNMPTLKGELEGQALRDDRVSSAVAKLVIDDSKPNVANFQVQLTMIGGQKPNPLSINVNV